jgi:hypothetical protein
MCLEIFPERICAAQTNGIDQSLVRFTLVWYGLISLLCTKQWFLTSHHPTNMQITTMLAARQNLAVGKTSPRHLSPICYILLVPGVPNDVGRHPQWNMWNLPQVSPSPPCRKGWRHQIYRKIVKCQLFLRFGRLWQVVVKDIGVLPINIFHVQ